MTIRLAAGDPAPPFSLPDAEDHQVSLSDFVGQQVIVYFYPAAMTPGCTTQAVDFTASLAELHDAGYRVVGISPDSVARLAEFRSTSSVGFPLLADESKQVLQSYGAYGEKLLYGKKVEGVIRSTFVVDVDDAGQGTIAVAQYNVKATGHVEKLKRDLKV